MKDYKRQHIIKHALEMYVQRPNVCEKDLKQELKVLEETKNKIAIMKDEYGIKEMDYQ
ncbi:hypothetical protein [Staphylococcus xylosus]|uniref:hypothetical protein n=1 Tax=Staphylococcus xylosus TaxID=1288 RepID=UPI0015F8B6C3|nr:hypothetical protein [Staphylococcus xylosus]